MTVTGASSGGRRRWYLPLGVAILGVGATGWCAFTWYQNEQAVAAVDSQLTAVMGRTAGHEAEVEVRQEARGAAGELRSKMTELAHRLFVNEERLKALTMKVDWFEARLEHAEAVVDFERCSAQVAGYRAEVEADIAQCQGQFSEHAECLAEFESSRSKGTATVGGLCALGAILLGGMTGGLGAGAIALCGGATVAAHALPEDHCGANPTCVTDRDAVTATILSKHGLDSMPLCTAPGDGPPAKFEDYVVWRSSQSAVASL